MRRPFFAVLGGMGTLATESYVRLLNQASQAHSDQDFLDYVVFNDASVPDRTAFILGRSHDDPFPVIADDVAKASAMGASFIVLTCNTAHRFFDRLQALASVPLLHMPREAVTRLSDRYPVVSHPRLGFLGTEGSLACGVYQREVERVGYRFVAPDGDLQRRVDALIYEDVKGDGVADRGRYFGVLDAMVNPEGDYRCDALMLGCTELSVLNEAFPLPQMPLVDAQQVLVDATVERARQLRGEPSEGACADSR